MSDLSGAIVDAVLRAIGAFYLFGAVAGLRRAAMDLLLTMMLGVIGSADPRETKAERERAQCLVVNLLLVGCGGIALMVLLRTAAWIFLTSLAFYALYLFVLAPRRFDPFDPPEEPGRSQTRNAFFVYAAATLLVCAAAWAERLTPLDKATPVALAVAGLGSAALLGYAVHVLRKVSISGKPSLADGNTSDESLAAKNEMTDPDAGLSPYDPDALVAQLKATPLVMRPGYHGAFYDARDGKLVQMPFFDDYTLDDDRDVSEWLALFFDLADHHDPARCALRNAADITKIEQAGLPIYRRLAARFGQDCIGFDPVAAPVLTHHQTASVKLMTDYPCDPLWLLGDEQCEPVSPDSFGISWQLARDITAWDAEADPDDQDNPSSTLQWSDAQLDAHEEKGRQLAVRLARELAATDRANVTVYNYHRNGGAREVRADDRIDATG